MSLVCALFAAEMASRKLQSESQTPSLVSAVFVTVKVAASETEPKDVRDNSVTRQIVKIDLFEWVLEMVKLAKRTNEWRVAGDMCFMRELSKVRKFGLYFIFVRNGDGLR
jgi:hypothetical protein